MVSVHTSETKKVSPDIKINESNISIVYSRALSNNLLKRSKTIILNIEILQKHWAQFSNVLKAHIPTSKQVEQTMWRSHSLLMAPVSVLICTSIQQNQFQTCATLMK